jgi:type II secretory pathway pseudopilin PulG
MEILVVVAILVILAGVGSVYAVRYLGESKKKVAYTNAKAIEKAAQAYYIDHNEAWPASLAVLAQPEDGTKPYIEREALRTPWGGEYMYDASGQKNGGLKPDIWAEAPGGVVIGNWSQQPG